jgi:homoserine O-succinyltransferase
MALVLARDYRFRLSLQGRGIACLSPEFSDDPALTPCRVGIINLMPKAELYEELLLSALGAALPMRIALSPVWIRLQDHSYASSDAEYLERRYVDFEEATRDRLDALILTGAPVEELPFHEVRYWSELNTILNWARVHVTSTLGICWGAMAMARLLGVQKMLLPRKLFGIYPFVPVDRAHPLFARALPHYAPQSRHAACSNLELELAAKEERVRLLAYSQQAGHTIFESTDRRFLMHQGHPEYQPARLVYEYERDRALGRRDVTAPIGVDIARPDRSAGNHGAGFLGAWVQGVTEREQTGASALPPGAPRTAGA